MARKDRKIASFGEVADTKIEENVNINVNDKVNENENTNDNGEETLNNTNADPLDELDQVLTDKKTKDKTHTMRGIYFENEVVRVIDKMARGKGKGAKSEIVNAAVKKVFKEKGWME